MLESIDENKWKGINTIYISMDLFLRYDELKNKYTKFNIFKYDEFLSKVFDKIKGSKNDDFIADEIYSKIFPEKRMMNEIEKQELFKKLKGQKCLTK